MIEQPKGQDVQMVWEEGDCHRQEGERGKPLPQNLAVGNRLRIRMAVYSWERCCWKRFLLIPKTYCQFSIHTSDAGSCYQHHVARKLGWKKKKTFNFYQDNVSLLFSFLRKDSPTGCNCRWEPLQEVSICYSLETSPGYIDTLE